MRIKPRLKSFADNRNGNVAMMFAFSLGLMVMVAGLAIDYARAYSIQSSMQADLDAAVLGAASKLSDPTEIQQTALKFFNSNWTAKHDVQEVSISVEKSDETNLIGTAKAIVPTSIMGIVGYPEINVSARTQIEVAGNEIELSLVLDTTASMAGPKIDALKTSAKALIEDVFAAPDAAGHVKIAVVPFGQYVNVGLGNRNQSWMDVPPDTSTPRQSCVTQPDITGTSNCRTETYSGICDGMPCSYPTTVCDYTYGPPVYRCTDYVDIYAWYGCAGSRNHPMDVEDGDWSTEVPGVLNASCGSEILPLTGTKEDLTAKIDSLTTSGDTYIPAGLFWGWGTLSKEGPFGEGMEYGEVVEGKPVRKIIVLMTDGFNTLSPTYPAHNGSDRVQANELTEEICANVRAKNIDLFTVAFEVPDSDTKNVLKRCATSNDHFFDAESPEELSEAFKTIAAAFTPLRIAK